MRILALVPGGIDDQILFFPTIDNLIGRYPDAEIDIVAEPRSMAAYRVSKSVRNVIPFDFNDVNGPADWGNLLGIIRDREYDAAMSTGQKFGVSFLLWLTGIPTRIGFGSGLSKLFISNSVDIDLNRYKAQTYHALVRGLGIADPCPTIGINIPKTDLDWAEAEQQRLGIKDSGYVLIHGGESAATDNTYPAKQWQQIVKDLQTRQPQIPVAIVKTDGNEEFVESLLTACPDLKVIAPTDVGKLTATIAGANLFLCTESAAMHLAGAVGTYTIALFGSSDPQKLLPETSRTIAVKSRTGNVADIPPADILERVWKG
jgi:ADP-heptose:LPS heptosyltransferase